MRLPPPFLIAVKGFRIPLLVGNLIYLAKAVVPVGDNPPVGVFGSRDVAGVIVCIPLHAAFRGVYLCNPAPRIEHKFCPVMVSVLDSCDIAPGVVGQSLGGGLFRRFFPPGVHGHRVPGQIIVIFRVDLAALQNGFQVSSVIIGSDAVPGFPANLFCRLPGGDPVSDTT